MHAWVYDSCMCATTHSTCHITHSVRPWLIMCVPWRMCHMPHSAHAYYAHGLYVCIMSHITHISHVSFDLWCVCHDPCMCVPWPMYVCTTRNAVWRGTWMSHTYSGDSTHINGSWHARISESWHTHSRNLVCVEHEKCSMARTWMSHTYVGRDAHTNGSWHMHTWVMTCTQKNVIWNMRNVVWHTHE